MDRGIAIELIDERQEIVFAGRGREIILHRMEAAGLRRLALRFDIDLARRIFADEDHSKPGPHAFRDERRGLGGHFGQHHLGRLLAVDQQCLAARWPENAVVGRLLLLRQSHGSRSS